MKILVTGAAGQLGSAIVKELGDKALPTLHKTLDITNRRACKDILRFEQPDAIINCAAFTHINAAEYRQETECMRVNVQGVKNLLDFSTCPFIQISTDYVFDGTASSPRDELRRTNPLNIYGRSKLLAEKILREANNHRAYIIRTSGLYAASHNNFVTQVLKNAEIGAPIHVACDRIMHLTYTVDLAKAIVYIATNEPRPGIYHIASRGVKSMFDYATTICQMAGLNAKIINDTNGVRYPKKIEFNQHLYESLWNAPAMPTWKDGLAYFFQDTGRIVHHVDERQISQMNDWVTQVSSSRQEVFQVINHWVREQGVAACWRVAGD